jgi:hypothetical protein
MKARIAIQIGVSPVEWKLLRKAAAKRRIPLATYVRQAALLYSEIYTGEEIDFEKDTLKVGVMGR